MRLQVLTLSLCLVESLAHPAPEGTLHSRQDNSTLPTPPSALSSVGLPPDQIWHGNLPELHWSTSDTDVSIATRTDISARQDPGDFRRYTYLGLQAYAVLNAGVSLYNIQKDCREFGEDTSASFNCVWASISTIIGFAVVVDRSIIIRGQLAERLSESGWHVPGINKRDDIPQLETHLSALLASEVRHVGIWDGHDGKSRELAKRGIEVEGVVPRHVFGGNFQGRDMHFTYMGELNDSSHFKFGFGPGVETENNRQRLRGRTVHKYNNQYFDQGGIDFTEQTDPINSNHGGVYLTPDDPNEFNWIVEQVACYFSGFGGNFFMGPAMGAHGANFQVYNSYDETTLAAGAFAPFTEFDASIITDMEVRGGLPTADNCNAL